VLVEYLLLGVVGALARILVHIHNYGLAKIRLERCIAHLALGAVAGYVAYYMILTMQLTNHLTAMAFGYMAPSLIDHILKKGELGT